MNLSPTITGSLSGHVDDVRHDSESAFLRFVTRDQVNRRYLWIALIGLTIQFIVFKILYPFPDFISDSYNYIETAALHMDVNLWPIGYAKFLAAFHHITYSDTALLAFQFILLESALLYFYFTFLYLYRPGRITARILFIGLFFNPMSLYLSNCVLSDALFGALTITCLVVCLWMFHRPRMHQIFVLALLTDLAFTVRYTAIYYPMVTAIAFALSRQRLAVKITGIIAPLILMIPFVIFTQQKTKAITGTAEFSVFGGWQLVNNALYMYDHIDVDNTALPASMQALDLEVKKFYKKVPPAYRDFWPFPGTYFIKTPYAVLKPYMLKRYKILEDYKYGQFLAWGMVSPLYHSYANYLMEHHPLAFTQYYLWMNAKNYLIPHLEKFGSYNIGEDSVWFPVQFWFHYPTPAVRVVSKQLQGILFFPYPTIFMILNIYFIACCLWLLFSRRIKQMPIMIKHGLLFISAFLFLNFCFSVFATPVVLRYQAVPMVLLFAFSLLLWELTNKPKIQNAQKY